MIVIVLLKKPDNSTATKTALEEGCGSFNIHECSIPRAPDDQSGWAASGSSETENSSMSGKNYARAPRREGNLRWPANVLIASEQVRQRMDQDSGITKGTGPRSGKRGGTKFGGEAHNDSRMGVWPNDSGGASRFFKKVKK